MGATSDVEIIGRLALAAFLCYLVGLERALQARQPGNETRSLAAVGAATCGRGGSRPDNRSRDLGCWRKRAGDSAWACNCWHRCDGGREPTPVDGTEDED